MKRKHQKNIVSEQRALVATTMLPANSASPPICWAMVKELTAVEEAKTGRREARATPRKPSSTAGITDAEGRLKAEYTVEGMHMYGDGYARILDALLPYLPEV